MALLEIFTQCPLALPHPLHVSVKQCMLSAHFIEKTPNSDHEMITIHSISPIKLAPGSISIHFVYAILAKTPVLPK